MNRHPGIDCYTPTSLLYRETDTQQSSTPWFVASSCREDVRNATVYNPLGSKQNSLFLRSLQIKPVLVGVFVE